MNDRACVLHYRHKMHNSLTRPASPFIIGLVILCQWFASPGVLFSQPVQDLRGEILKIIRHDIKGSLAHVPGFIIGVIDGDHQEIHAFGIRDREHGGILTPDDRFEIGSLTKVMTAHLIMDLHAQGLLDLNDPLDNYIPQTYRNRRIAASLLDILTHTGGIPKFPETLGAAGNSDNGPYSVFSDENLLTWYRDTEPRKENAFLYSHSGYALLGIVISQVTSKAYTESFADKFNNTLGLQNTTCTPGPGLTPGYDLALRPAVSWSFASFQSSEGATSCLTDLMQYIRYLLSDAPETALMWATFRPSYDKKLLLAPGWYCFTPKKHARIYVHSGRSGGHSAMIAFSRETRTGVIILANTSAGTDDLALLILRMINRQWKRK